MLIFLTQFALAVLLLVFMQFLGASKSMSREYVSLSDIFDFDRNIGFNAFIRILAAPVFIVFISTLFLLLGQDYLTENIWIISVFYFLLQFLLIAGIFERWKLINKAKFFLYHIFSIGISYLVYASSISSGLNHLLPDGANFRTELWLVIILFFYQVLNNTGENFKNFEKRKNNFILQRFENFKGKYGNLLKNESKEIKRIIYAIMIYEDFVRPKLFRFLEKTFFKFGFIKTTGVMQVKDGELLDDEKSIKKSIKIIKEMFEKVAKKPKAEDVDPVDVFRYYNGNDYFHKVGEIYDYLKNVLKI